DAVLGVAARLEEVCPDRADGERSLLGGAQCPLQSQLGFLRRLKEVGDVATNGLAKVTVVDVPTEGKEEVRVHAIELMEDLAPRDRAIRRAVEIGIDECELLRLDLLDPLAELLVLLVEDRPADLPVLPVGGQPP